MISAKQTIGQIAHSQPGAIELFQSLGIQYCCHGQEEIDSASKAVGVPVSELLAKLQQTGRTSCASKASWINPILEALIAHLIRSRRSMTSKELPHITSLARSLAQCGDRVPPHGVELAMVVEALVREVEVHLAKEEAVLFPLIQEVELAYIGEGANAVRPRTLHRRVGKMVHEHEQIGYLLSAARRLTDGFEGTSSCCAPYRELCDQLRVLDGEIREEVHLENNVLFHRALQFSDAVCSLPQPLR